MLVLVALGAAGQESGDLLAGGANVIRGVAVGPIEYLCSGFADVLARGANVVNGADMGSAECRDRVFS